MDLIYEHASGIHLPYCNYCSDHYVTVTWLAVGHVKILSEPWIKQFPSRRYSDGSNNYIISKSSCSRYAADFPMAAKVEVDNH